MLLEIPHQGRRDRVILLGVEEILGPDTAHRLIGSNFGSNSSHAELADKCGSVLVLNDLIQVQSCLEMEYGSAVGRGLAVRSGRACFKHILREFGDELGLTGKEFHYLPLVGRLNLGSGSLAKLINQYTSFYIEQKTDKDSILWTVGRPPGVGDSKIGSPACQFMIGILQEALYWFSGGKTFQVEETQCVCQGSTCCSICIRKKPI